MDASETRLSVKRTEPLKEKLVKCLENTEEVKPEQFILKIKIKIHAQEKSHFYCNFFLFITIKT